MSFLYSVNRFVSGDNLFINWQDAAEASALSSQFISPAVNLLHPFPVPSPVLDWPA
jgi:hypothetical protein